MPVVAIKIDRFENFTDDERYLLAEALRSHLATKREVFEKIDAGKLSSVTHFLSESDFGIPALSKLLDENGY